MRPRLNRVLFICCCLFCGSFWSPSAGEDALLFMGSPDCLPQWAGSPCLVTAECLHLGFDSFTISPSLSLWFAIYLIIFTHSDKKSTAWRSSPGPYRTDIYGWHDPRLLLQDWVVEAKRHVEWALSSRVLSSTPAAALCAGFVAENNGQCHL